MNETENTLEIMTEAEAYANYDQFLDECYPVATFGYSKFYASTVIKECDPIAYRIGFADYIDMLADEGTAVEGWSA